MLYLSGKRRDSRWSVNFFVRVVQMESLNPPVENWISIRYMVYGWDISAMLDPSNIIMHTKHMTAMYVTLDHVFRPRILICNSPLGSSGQTPHARKPAIMLLVVMARNQALEKNSVKTNLVTFLPTVLSCHALLVLKTLGVGYNG